MEEVSYIGFDTEAPIISSSINRLNTGHSIGATGFKRIVLRNRITIIIELKATACNKDFRVSAVPVD